MLSETHLPTYVGIKDHQKVIVNKVTGSEMLLICMLTYKNEIQPGTKWYIPCKKEKRTHTDAAEFLNNLGFNVLVVNGDGLNLHMHDGEIIQHERESIEFFLPKIYNAYSLAKRPFAITGFICIERGITLMSEEFRLTHAIIPYIANNNQAYQCAGRCGCNCPNGFPKKIKIFCTEVMWNKICMYETAAKKFAEKSKDSIEENNKSMKTSEDYKAAKRAPDRPDDQPLKKKRRPAKPLLHNHPEVAKIMLEIQKNCFQ